MDENPYEPPTAPSKEADPDAPQSRWVVQALVVIALAVVAMYFALDLALAWVRQQLPN